jgi:hypothetical protein
MRMKFTALLTAFVLMLFAAASAVASEVVERKFVSGGTITLTLAAGDYDIVASPDDRIRVTVSGPHAADTDVDIDVRGSRATVVTTGPRRDGVDARIELPRRANIVLTLTAGDLKVSGIEGSKDVSARAGDVTIEVGSRDQYRSVRASIRIGDLDVEPFDVQKDGFFRSFEWNGKGQYDLLAHLTVGDLKLTR